jgi:hypothetical protein
MTVNSAASAAFVIRTTCTDVTKPPLSSCYNYKSRTFLSRILDRITKGNSWGVAPGRKELPVAFADVARVAGIPVRCWNLVRSRNLADLSTGTRLIVGRRHEAAFRRHGFDTLVMNVPKFLTNACFWRLIARLFFMLQSNILTLPT